MSCQPRVQSGVQSGIQSGVLTSNQGTDLGLQLSKAGQLGEAGVEQARISSQERMEAGHAGVERVGREGTCRGRGGTAGRG